MVSHRNLIKELEKKRSKKSRDFTSVIMINVVSRKLYHSSDTFRDLVTDLVSFKFSLKSVMIKITKSTRVIPSLCTILDGSNWSLNYV